MQTPSSLLLARTTQTTLSGQRQSRISSGLTWTRQVKLSLRKSSTMSWLTMLILIQSLISEYRLQTSRLQQLFRSSSVCTSGDTAAHGSKAQQLWITGRQSSLTSMAISCRLQKLRQLVQQSSSASLMLQATSILMVLLQAMTLSQFPVSRRQESTQ